MVGASTETGFPVVTQLLDMHVRVNVAVSADGKLSTVDRQQVRISGSDDFDRVDALRAEADAVMVGIGTVLADDPSLTIDDPDRIARRQQSGRNDQPMRVVTDSYARVPPDARVLDDTAETTILVSAEAPAERREAIVTAGNRIHAVGTNRVDLRRGLQALETDGISTILVEGGGEVIFSLFESGLVDEVSMYVGDMIIGGTAAPTMADGVGYTERSQFPRLERRSVTPLDEGVLIEWSVAKKRENRIE